jgi:hypothetical protein
MPLLRVPTLVLTGELEDSLHSKVLSGMWSNMVSWHRIRLLDHLSALVFLSVFSHRSSERKHFTHRTTDTVCMCHEPFLSAYSTISQSMSVVGPAWVRVQVIWHCQAVDAVTTAAQ